MNANSRFRTGDRVRVVAGNYGTCGRCGTVTEPDEFWTFGPCVILDGQDLPGAYLDDDLEALADERPAGRASERSFSSRRAPEPRRPPAGERAAEPVSEDEGYARGIKEGWGQAVRHVAHRLRVEGGEAADPRSIAPDVAGLLAGIVARLDAAETRVLASQTALTRRDDRIAKTTVLAPEPAGEPGLSAKTLTLLIQAVSEIVIQERERARLQWEGQVKSAEAQVRTERAARHAAESALADLHGRAASAAPGGVVAGSALVEVLTCAEEFISGAALNRALVLHALRDTLGNLRQVSALDEIRAQDVKRLR